MFCWMRGTKNRGQTGHGRDGGVPDSGWGAHVRDQGARPTLRRSNGYGLKWKEEEEEEEGENSMHNTKQQDGALYSLGTLQLLNVSDGARH